MKKITCDICEKDFEYKDNLRRHMREVHGGERQKCEVCPATFTRKGDLQNHKESGGHYLPFYCCICNKELVFKHLGGLIEHVVAKQSEKNIFYPEDGSNLKLMQSGITLTCKSRLKTIQVEKGDNVLGMDEPKQLEGFKERMRKREEIINYGLKKADGSTVKTSVKLEFKRGELNHQVKEGKNRCQYCWRKPPFTNDYCERREQKKTRLGMVWTLEHNTEN